MNKIFATAFLVLGTLGSPAQAAPQFGILGVLNMANYSGSQDVTKTPGFQGRTNFGFGGFFRGEGPTTLEIGLLYAPRRLYDASYLGAYDFTYHMLELPVMLRVTALPFITFGVGGYLAQRLGAVSGTGAQSTLSPGNTDLGLVGAAGVEIPVTESIGVIAEARYIFGLLDMGGAYGTLHWRNWEALLGGRFTL